MLDSAKNDKLWNIFSGKAAKAKEGCCVVADTNGCWLTAEWVTTYI